MLQLPSAVAPRRALFSSESTPEHRNRNRPDSDSDCVGRRNSEPSTPHRSPRFVADSYDVDSRCPLGQGSAGTIFRGRPHDGGPQRAIKAVPVAGQGSRQAAKNEAHVLRRMNHPCVCKLVDTFEDMCHVYLVLEMIDGCELFDEVIERGPLGDTDRGLDVAKQLFEALYHCHVEASVVHNDLKPENIMLQRGDTQQDEVKLVDFGSATILPGATDNKLADEACDGRFLRPNEDNFVGTSAYLPPEASFSSSVSRNEPMDMWAAGLVLFAMLSGRLPSASPGFERREADAKAADQQGKRPASRSAFEVAFPSWSCFSKCQTDDHESIDGSIQQVSYGNAFETMAAEQLKDAGVSSVAASLVLSLLRVDPEERLTVSQALRHRWFSADKGVWKPQPCLPSLHQLAPQQRIYQSRVADVVAAKALRPLLFRWRLQTLRQEAAARQGADRNLVTGDPLTRGDLEFFLRSSTMECAADVTENVYKVFEEHFGLQSGKSPTFGDLIRLLDIAIEDSLSFWEVSAKDSSEETPTSTCYLPSASRSPNESPWSLQSMNSELFMHSTPEDDGPVVSFGHALSVEHNTNGGRDPRPASGVFGCFVVPQTSIPWQVYSLFNDGLCQPGRSAQPDSQPRGSQDHCLPVRK